MKPIMSGGAIITNTGFVVAQTRESVRNPEPRSVQVNRTRTGTPKKINKAPAQTVDQWHVEITKNPDALFGPLKNMDHALAHLGTNGQDKSKQSGGGRFPGIEQAINKAAHSKAGHAITWTANAIASVPDGGNVKRNMKAVLSLSKDKTIADKPSITSRAGLRAAYSGGTAAVGKMLGVSGKAPAGPEQVLAETQSPKAASEATVLAYRTAIATAKKHEAATRILNHATALQDDLTTALRNSALAADKLGTLTQGRPIVDFLTDVNRAQGEHAAAKKAYQPAQERLDKAQLALDHHNRTQAHNRQELETIKAYPQKLATAKAELEQLSLGFMQRDGQTVQADWNNAEQMQALAKQIEQQEQLIGTYTQAVQDTAGRKLELEEKVGESGDGTAFARAIAEETFLRAEHDSARIGLEKPRAALDQAQAKLTAAEEKYAAIKDLELLFKKGREVTQTGLKQIENSIKKAQYSVDVAAAARENAALTIKDAEKREMGIAIQALPGFDPQATEANPVRLELNKIAEKLDARPIDMSKSRMPSSAVMNVVIGGLAEAAVPNRATEKVEDAAGRRLTEARQILEEFDRNLPPTSSPAHERWHSSIKSLPGGIVAMDQLGRRNPDEEKPVVFANQVAAHAKAALAAPNLPPDEKSIQKDLVRIASEVARRGHIDGLKEDDKTLFEEAVSQFVGSPSTARDVAVVAHAANQVENISEAARTKNDAALDVARHIQEHGNADGVSLEQKEHYEEVLRDALVTKRTAGHVAERAQGALAHNVPGADRATMQSAVKAAGQIAANGHTQGVAAKDLKAFNAVLKEQKDVRRIGERVEALARNTLDRNVEGADANMMQKAAAAAAVIASQGHDYGVSEADRAHFYAVRNGFISPHDPKLLAAQAGFDKLNNEWLERAHESANKGRLDAIPSAKLKKANVNGGEARPSDPAQLTREAAAATQAARAKELQAQGPREPAKGWLKFPRNTMQDKTPFNPTALREAATISTLGYADPARPMLRLDKVTNRVMAHMEKCVKTLPPQSLTLEQAVGVAAILATNDKAKSNTKVRPGHVALEQTDLGRITDIMSEPQFAEKMNPVHASIDDIRKEVGLFLGEGGKTPADALELKRTVDSVIGRIPAKLADGSENVARMELMKDLSIATEMTSTDTVTEIHNAVDLYNHLKPKIQQLELRGKEKSSSGGALGASSKLVTFPVNLAAGVTGLPRGAVAGAKTRNAVFEIGFSTTGFEIFVGSETRKGSALIGSAGFRGELGEIAAAGLGVDKTLSGDSSKTPGVWLKFPRGDGDEVVRDRALVALQELLGIEDKDGVVTMRDPGADQVPGTEIPFKVAKLLANNPNMSMSMTGDYKETNFRNELGGGFNPGRLKLGTASDAPGVTLGQAGATTARRTKEFKYSDDTGYMRLTRSNKFSGGIAFAQAQLGVVAENFSTSNPEKTLVSLGNLLAQARQIAEKGIDTKYRGISRDGEINAVDTRIDKENLSLEDHIERINADRQAWIECGVNELFKKGDPTPLREKYRIAEAWLDDHLEAVKAVAEGNGRHVFSLSYALENSAQGVLNGIMAEAEQHKRLASAPQASTNTATPSPNASSNTGTPAPKARMKTATPSPKVDHAKLHDEKLAIADLVFADPSSWKEWKITASERTSEKLRKGLMFGVEFTGNIAEEGQRGFNSYPK